MKTFLVQLCAESAQKTCADGGVLAARVTAVAVANDAVEAKVSVLDHILRSCWKPLTVEFARELDDTQEHILDLPIQQLYRKAKTYGLDSMFEVTNKPNSQIEYRCIFKRGLNRGTKIPHPAAGR